MGAPTRAAAFFDLDKTVIAKSSTLAFGRPFYKGGLINRRTVLRSSVAHFLFLVGGADADQMDRMRDYIEALCVGWDVQQVRDIVEETLHELIDPLIYEEAAALIAAHQNAGRDVVIVSSSGAEVVEPVGEMLGVDRVVATRMVVADGRYTGEIEFYAYGEGKAEAMRHLAESEGYDLAGSYAYSDSVTDLPMLTAVGHPTAVNPDRGLRKAARENDWPILEFDHPVPLRERVPALPAPPVSVVTGVGVAAGAAAVGLAWWVTASRRR